MLVIPILLVILFLVGGGLVLGRGWMSNAYNAENNVYTEVVSGRNYLASNDPEPAPGFFMPLLPNRYATANEMQSIQISGIRPPINTALYDRAILLDAAWHYSAWPQTGDRAALQEWFGAYVGESHPTDVVEALGLAAPGPP
jgi:hypothetical protein